MQDMTSERVPIVHGTIVHQSWDKVTGLTNQFRLCFINPFKLRVLGVFRVFYVFGWYYFSSTLRQSSQLCIPM